MQIKPSLGIITTYSSTFNAEQVEILYNLLKDLDSQLMPLSIDEISPLACQYEEKLKIKHRLNKTTMKDGKHFYNDFMKWHEDLRLITAESSSLQNSAFTLR